MKYEIINHNSMEALRLANNDLLAVLQNTEATIIATNALIIVLNSIQRGTMYAVKAILPDEIRTCKVGNQTFNLYYSEDKREIIDCFIFLAEIVNEYLSVPVNKRNADSVVKIIKKLEYK